MVIIRLSRTGRKNVSLYRIEVVDSRNRRDCRSIEKLGEYNPNTYPASCKINHERALYWLKKGVQLSDTVRSLFHRDGITKKFSLAAKGLDAANVVVEKKVEKAKKPSKSKKIKAKETGAQKEEEKKENQESPKKE